MGECKIDHSHGDVRKKFEEQSAYLPNKLNPLFASFFAKEHPQSTLNEVFHLLKKYDLATEEEKNKRNAKFQQVLNNS